jgi:hypothetical protein
MKLLVELFPNSEAHYIISPLAWMLLRPCHKFLSSILISFRRLLLIKVDKYCTVLIRYKCMNERDQLNRRYSVLQWDDFQQGGEEGPAPLASFSSFDDAVAFARATARLSKARCEMDSDPRFPGLSDPMLSWSIPALDLDGKSYASWNDTPLEIYRHPSEQDLALLEAALRRRAQERKEAPYLEHVKEVRAWLRSRS